MTADNRSPQQAALAADSPPRVRILVVDDHAILRAGIVSLLTAAPDMDVVAQACDGEEAVSMTRQFKPDAILMDLTMRRMGGIDATRIIHQEFPAVRIIALTMHDDEFVAAAMEKAGACAYLPKGCSTPQLLDTIRRAVFNSRTG